MNTLPNRKKTKSYHSKALVFTIAFHLAIVGGILFSTGELQNFFSDQNHIEASSGILDKALSKTSSDIDNKSSSTKRKKAS